MQKPKRTEPIAHLELSASGLVSHEQHVHDHLQHLLGTLMNAAKEVSSPPGIAVMAAAEFISLMIHFNIARDESRQEVSRIADHINDRIQQLSQLN